MNNDKMNNLDEVIECAIRERGAREYAAELDRKQRATRRNIFVLGTSSIAACLVAFVCAGFVLSSRAVSAGKSFHYEDEDIHARGSSEIVALMKQGNIDEAKEKIAAALLETEHDIDSPYTDDEEYLAQLDSDKQTLEMLNTVCKMLDGKYFTARKALKNIAGQDGIYSEEAAELLDNM